jgi:hypothetical protein
MAPVSSAPRQRLHQIGDDRYHTKQRGSRRNNEQVIETKALRGSGTTKDPVRVLTQYWDLEGILLAERDEI